MPAYFDIDRLYTTKGQEKNFDSEPKEGSVNYISSGSVYTALQELKDKIADIEVPNISVVNYDVSENIPDISDDITDEERLSIFVNYFLETIPGEIGENENPISAKTAIQYSECLFEIAIESMIMYLEYTCAEEISGSDTGFARASQVYEYVNSVLTSDSMVSEMANAMVSSLTPVTTKIGELETKNIALEAKITVLEAKNTSLEERIAALEAKHATTEEPSEPNSGEDGSDSSETTPTEETDKSETTE